MPPKAKLHNKSGKSKKIPKTIPVTPQPSTSSEQQSSEENDTKFAIELLWCIQQLENTVENKNITPKQAEESLKVLKILRNNGQPLVRKRQLMRQYFGDYRSKMAAEEKKAKKASNKMSISTVTPSTSKSTFIRKSATLTMGDNSFRFNFTPPAVTEESVCPQVEKEESNTNSKSDAEESSNLTMGIKKLNFGSEMFKFDFDVSGKT